MRGFASVNRKHFIPIIDPLLGPTKTRPRDRSNRLLEPLQPVPWALPIMRNRQQFHRNSGIAENY